MAGGWIGVLSDELREWGLDERSASALAGEFVARQPYPLETGATDLAIRLRDHGLDEERADDAATTLLAVSLFNARRNLGDVRRLLDRAGIEGAMALGAAMEGARIRREIRRSAEERQAEVQQMWQGLAPALVFTGLTVLLFVMAGTIG